MIRPIGRQHCVLLFGSYFYKSNQIKNKFKLPTYTKMGINKQLASFNDGQLT